MSKIRLLYDLSYGAHGYTGIPQETRLLFKALADLDEVEVDGLLLALGMGTFHFSEKQMHRLQNNTLDAQEYIGSLTSHLHAEKIEYEKIPPVLFYKRLKTFLHLISKSKFSVINLPVDAYLDYIWRCFFAKTLAHTDYEQVMHKKFYATALSWRAATLYTLLKKKAYLNTKGWDFVLFQNQKAITVHPETIKLVRYYDSIPLTSPDVCGPDYCSHRTDMKQCSEDSIYVCISNSARDGLLKFRPQLENKSVVIPCIVLPQYHKVHDDRKREALLGNGEYILCVSSLEPRKNYLTLIRAWERYRNKHNSDLKLVIVASAGWKNDEIKQTMSHYLESGDIVHLSGIAFEELMVVYSHAKALVFLSYQEGFGYAPLEAMQCECPTIVSDIPVFHEVMGEASLYCNPYDIDSVVGEMEKLFISTEAAEIRERLIASGLKQVALYSEDNVRGQWQELLPKLKTDRKLS
tara:strand:+ start:31798 stop:33189 length:1392 start_codon:yes stop_codon:yes gene_type:complete